MSVVVGCFAGLWLASRLLRTIHPQLGAADLLDPTRDSWQALLLNVSVMVGALAGLAMAYFIMGGREL